MSVALNKAKLRVKQLEKKLQAAKAAVVTLAEKTAQKIAAKKEKAAAKKQANVSKKKGIKAKKSKLTARKK